MTSPRCKPWRHNEPPELVPLGETLAGTEGVMADSEVGRGWTRWTTSFEWAPDCDPTLRGRVEAFLERAMRKTAILAARLHEGIDTDLIVAMALYFEQVGTVFHSEAGEAIDDIHAWVVTYSDETRVGHWTQVIQDTLAEEAAPIQFVSVAILAGRVIHAAMARCEGPDTEGDRLPATDALEARIREVLRDVLTHKIAREQLPHDVDRSCLTEAADS